MKECVSVRNRVSRRNQNMYMKEKVWDQEDRIGFSKRKGPGRQDVLVLSVGIAQRYFVCGSKRNSGRRQNVWLLTKVRDQGKRILGLCNRKSPRRQNVWLLEIGTRIQNIWMLAKVRVQEFRMCVR